MQATEDFWLGNGISLILLDSDSQNWNSNYFINKNEFTEDMNCVLFHLFTTGPAQDLLHRNLINVEQFNLSNPKIIYKIHVGEVKGDL